MSALGEREPALKLGAYALSPHPAVPGRERRQPDQPVATPERRPVAWAIAFTWVAIVLLTLAGFALGSVIGRVDWSGALDFVAPTAAQVRDGGWVALSENR